MHLKFTRAVVAAGLYVSLATGCASAPATSAAGPASIAEAQQQLKVGQTTPTRLTQASLDRIAAIDKPVTMQVFTTPT